MINGNVDIAGPFDEKIFPIPCKELTESEVMPQGLLIRYFSCRDNL
jgi:hypothetical protein